MDFDVVEIALVRAKIKTNYREAMKACDVVEAYLKGEELPEHTAIRNRLLEFGLSRRQRQIALLLLQSKTSKEIKQELHISLSAIKGHISIILAKLHIESRHEVAWKLVQP